VQLQQIVGKGALVAPELISGFHVERDDLGLRRRDEHDAVVDDGRRFVPFDHAGRKRPRQLQIFDVARVDLVERAERGAVVCAHGKRQSDGLGLRSSSLVTGLY
jgi:hypothetical protein